MIRSKIIFSEKKSTITNKHKTAAKVAPPSSSYLFVTEVMHPIRNIHSKLQQLLGGEGGSSTVLFGKGRVRLQHPTLPQEVKEVTIGGVFYGYVQITWSRQRDRWTDISVNKKRPCHLLINILPSICANCYWLRQTILMKLYYFYNIL